MINRIKQFQFPVIIILLLAALLLAGCGGEGQKARKPPGDFSRGLPLSDEATSPPAAAINPEGALIQVLIPVEREESVNVFRFLQIDQTGRKVKDEDLDLELAPFLRSPSLISNGSELHLVWAARESTLRGWGLWHAIINTDGELTSAPKLISAGTERVSKFAATGDEGGNLTVVWEDSQDDSILVTSVSGRGGIISPPETLVAEGTLPSLVADDGTIHVSWMEGDDLYYAALSEDSALPLEGEVLTDIQVALGNRLDGPVIGVADDHVFLFWSILRQVGLEAGTAVTESLVFPKGDPRQTQRELVPIFPVSEDLLQPYQGSLALSEAVPAPPEDYMTTQNILDPRTLPQPAHGAQVVAVSASQVIRLDDHMQIMLGIFEDGVYQSYAIGTRTTEISQNPIIFVDEAGNLHLIWQEGYSGKRVFYATTAPEARERLDRVALADLPNLILSGGIEAITGVLLFPFALPWMAIGFGIMIVLRLTRNDEDVTQRLSQILLVVALLSYQVSKVLFLPDILIYVPFSAWLDVPQRWSLIFRIAVPIIIIGLGIGAAEWRRRRKTSPISSLGYYMTAVIVDTALTLAIYGVIFLGEY